MGPERRTAIMQPYVFPYLGYYQLFHASDVFVSLDDAAFIKRGWVNRNRILLQGKAHTFAIPISAQSQNVSIRDSKIAPDDGWLKKLLATFVHAYRKAPHFENVFPVIEQILDHSAGSIADVAERSLFGVLDYLGMPRSIHRSSEMDIDPVLHGQDRILAICEKMGTDTYVNPKGGRELYLPEHFAARGMRLRFLHMEEVVYQQGASNHFEPGLSMIDVLMWNSKDAVRQMMATYTLQG